MAARTVKQSKRARKLRRNREKQQRKRSSGTSATRLPRTKMSEVISQIAEPLMEEFAETQEDMERIITRLGRDLCSGSRLAGLRPHPRARCRRWARGGGGRRGSGCGGPRDRLLSRRRRIVDHANPVDDRHHRGCDGDVSVVSDGVYMAGNLLCSND